MIVPPIAQIDVNQESLRKRSVKLATQPITIVDSEREYHTGDVVAVNDTFLCYVVKGQKIRVLARKHSARALLRCGGDVADLRFVRANDDTLVGVTSSGDLYVWTLRLTADAIAESLVGHAQLNADAGAVCGIERVALHAVDDGASTSVVVGIVYTVANNLSQFHMFSLSTLTSLYAAATAAAAAQQPGAAAATPPPSVAPPIRVTQLDAAVGSHCLATTARANDLCFAQSRSAAHTRGAVGLANGDVLLFVADNGGVAGNIVALYNSATSASDASRWARGITSIRFIGPGCRLLLVGASGNTEFQLWLLNDTGVGVRACLQVKDIIGLE